MKLFEEQMQAEAQQYVDMNALHSLAKDPDAYCEKIFKAGFQSCLAILQTKVDATELPKRTAEELRAMWLLACEVDDNNQQEIIKRDEEIEFIKSNLYRSLKALETLTKACEDEADNRNDTPHPTVFSARRCLTNIGKPDESQRAVFDEEIAQLKEEQKQWEPQWTSNAAANAAGYNQAMDKFQKEIEGLQALIKVYDEVLQENGISNIDFIKISQAREALEDGGANES